MNTLIAKWLRDWHVSVLKVEMIVKLTRVNVCYKDSYLIYKGWWVNIDFGIYLNIDASFVMQMS